MKLILSLLPLVLEPGMIWEPPAGAGGFLVESGSVKSDQTEVGTDEGGLISGNLLGLGERASKLSVFLLTQDVQPECIERQDVEVGVPFLLRLDEVSFPPAAVAYRHVHPGPGFRHLRRGALTLETDDHSFEAVPGSTWFEPANSPVRATASSDAPETRFVRCMVLPPEYRGKSTIQILDPKDALRPKRQVTHRHVDHVVEHWDQVDAG